MKSAGKPAARPAKRRRSSATARARAAQDRHQIDPVAAAAERIAAAPWRRKQAKHVEAFVKRYRGRAPEVWLRRLALIPGYDCFASAAPGDWFDHETADARVEFFECLRHVKGPQAGELFILEDWERAIVGAMYGWMRRDGKRRYRKAFVYIPKKNGKTALVSGFVFCGLIVDGELSAEIYSAAASKDQASIIFNNVKGMIKLEPELDRMLTVYGAKGGSQQRSVVYESTMSTYRPLASDEDTADGLMPHVSVIDELHRHRDGALLDILERGTSSRSQPMTVIITTADYDRPSACNSTYDEAVRVRDNGGDPDRPGHDPSFLPVIYEAESKADWTDPAVWAQANPNLGVSKSLEYMVTACKKAQEDPVARNLFQRLELNIRTQHVESLIDLVEWDACPGERIDERMLVGRRCFAAIDLSQSNDLTSECYLFPPVGDETLWRFIWRFWCASETIRKRSLQRIPYQSWADAGWISVSEGTALDYPAIKRQILADAELFHPVEIRFDPYNASDITRDLLNSHGLPMVECAQTFRLLSDPTKRMMQLVNSHVVAHGGNPIARWCAGNVAVKADDKDNIQPVKRKSKDKIDGFVAAVMALGGAMAGPPDEQKSVYEMDESQISKAIKACQKRSVYEDPG